VIPIVPVFPARNGHGPFRWRTRCGKASPVPFPRVGTLPPGHCPRPRRRRDHPCVARSAVDIVCRVHGSPAGPG
jgi:hypothetical protein